MQLEVNGIDIAYGELTIVKQVSLSLAAGQIGCLLGPSGCGKTTLLRAIAGFEPPRNGDIRISGEVVSRPGRVLAPERRRIGMVFQDFALFPHLTIEQNVAFGLQGWSREQQRSRIDRLFCLINMESFRSVYPHQLSGGQQQRVAIARALAPKPELLLLDEPFSSLDVELREELAREVRALLKEEGITAILVTHDQMEAFAMADEIGVMNDGRICQWDSGYALYHCPADRFVADFIGQGVFLPGTVIDEQRVETEMGVIQGQIPPKCLPGCRVEVLLRPDDVVDVDDDTAVITAVVVEKAFRGADYLYTLRLPSGIDLLCLTHSHHDYRLGEAVSIRPDVNHVVTFPLAADGEG